MAAKCQLVQHMAYHVEVWSYFWPLVTKLR